MSNPPEPDNSALATTSTERKKMCLIVDDSRIVRKVTRRIIETLGLECEEAENGQDALDYCCKNMPDVVLIDWQMPEMNGLAFLKKIRAGHTKKNGGDPDFIPPKIIFCSTQNSIHDIRNAVESGADEYIMKPFDTEIIRSKLFFAGVLEAP